MTKRCIPEANCPNGNVCANGSNGLDPLGHLIIACSSNLLFLWAGIQWTAGLGRPWAWVVLPVTSLGQVTSLIYRASLGERGLMVGPSPSLAKNRSCSNDGKICPLFILLVQQQPVEETSAQRGWWRGRELAIACCKKPQFQRLEYC